MPAWLMVAALIVFAGGKRFYAVEKVIDRDSRPDEHPASRGSLARLYAMFAFMVFFWIAYEHNDSMWVFFARDYVNRSVPGLSRPVPADQIQLLNPLFVLITIPVLDWSFKKLDPGSRIFTPIRKVLLSFGFGAVATAVTAVAGYLADGHAGSVSIVWLVSAYIILTVGEVLLYRTGLEMAYTMAPANMKGFVTASLLLTITAANLFNSWWCRFYGGSLVDAADHCAPLSPGTFFAMTAILVAIAGIGFAFMARRLKGSTEALAE